MKCLTCGKRTLRTKAMCWRKWQLCVGCAVKNHPDLYHIRQINAHKQ